MSDFSPIVQYSDWGYFDQLDGKTLQEGEKLFVRWPDGSETQHICHIKSTSIYIMEHGSHCDIPTVQAIVRINHNGVQAEIPLRQPGIKCRRVTSTSVAKY